MLFAVPTLAERDLRVVAELDSMRLEMRQVTQNPKRWTGLLRRTLLARAIQGSNSIEGYAINDDDAIAAVDEQAPLDADEGTWAEILGYRSAMSYVLQLTDDPHFTFDASLLRSLHYMLLSHDITKSPGRYRAGPIFVRNERTDTIVYEGPAWTEVAGLVGELVRDLCSATDAHPVYVRAAMAHLNLVMIHPFRDGNGRMARCLQTLVLSRDKILAPVFSSIEEFLGANTDDYYAVLGATGRGSWHPEHDATAWVRFNLRAHHMQAQTVSVRHQEAGALWLAMEALVDTHGLPDRTVPALCDAALGLRLRRSGYERSSGVASKTATRDLAALVAAGLLLADGQTRGRQYRGSAALRLLHTDVRAARPPVRDPYPDRSSWLIGGSADRSSAGPAAPIG